MNTKQNIQVLQLGALVLIIQNLLIFLGLVALIPKNFIYYDFYIDIIGFIILGIGFILYAQQKQALNTKGYFFRGGILILMWIILRIIWQIILGGNILFSNISNTSASSLTAYLPVFFTTVLANIAMLFAFIPAGIALGIASIYIYRSKKNLGTKKNFDGVLFLAFGLINMITILIMGFSLFSVAMGVKSLGFLTLIALALKLVFIPFLAIITFIAMLITLPKLITPTVQ